MSFDDDPVGAIWTAIRGLGFAVVIFLLLGTALALLVLERRP